MYTLCTNTLTRETKTKQNKSNAVSKCEMACMRCVLCNNRRVLSMYTYQDTRKFRGVNTVGGYIETSVSLKERRFRLELGRPFGVSLTLLFRLVEVVAPPASSFAAASVVVAGGLRPCPPACQRPLPRPLLL